MGYLESHIDKQNRAWFSNDNSCQTLEYILLHEGSFRGVHPCLLQFKYPISVISGPNGSGKSTILAMAACAFHNTDDGYLPEGRDKNYYTFGDFFVQAEDEVPPEGIKIIYQIRHNNWQGSTPVGPNRQERKKRIGGRWNNYERRVRRNVIYFGIQRVVPHYERNTHKNYRRNFSVVDINHDHVIRIRDIAGRILNKEYLEFEIHEHSKYRLPVVNTQDVLYSGFNMGAGESAIFSILLSIFQAGRGSLLVIDEIELGLHEKAQRRFIDELKILCLELHCQIICSSHSPIVLESVPPEARLFIEPKNGYTNVIPGISAAYACGKLSGRHTQELDIFVEDEVGASLVMGILPLELRQRLRILPIGSSEAVLRQIAARYRENNYQFIVFLDGDKRHEHQASIRKVKNYLENRFEINDFQMTEWINARLHYLPGERWPEVWLIEQLLEMDNRERLEQDWGCDDVTISGALGEALIAGKHNEFYSLQLATFQETERLRSDIIRFLYAHIPKAFEGIIQGVNFHLET